MVWGDRVWITAAIDDGTKRRLYCFDRQSGARHWMREIEHEDPELTSAVTGHAAATPATDGKHVVAAFGNAGIACWNVEGDLLWHVSLGPFETELGLASSPVIDRDQVFLLCDHDGDRFRSFDSFLLALDVRTGKVRWQAQRPKLYRSWSTPLVLTRDRMPHLAEDELIVCAQDEVRAYAIDDGELLWTAAGMTGWVAPTPVLGERRIYATSGRNGPILALRPGGRGNVTNTHVDWQVDRHGPYVCSPLYYKGLLYVHDSDGILRCFDAETGEQQFVERLKGKFTASAVAAAERVYLTNEEGTTFVFAAERNFQLLAENPLDEYTVASPAIAHGAMFLRTATKLYCLQGPERQKAPGAPSESSREPPPGKPEK